MTNIDNSPIFIDSTLKVTANEDVDITKDLASENENNLTIEELLKQQNAKEE